MDSYTEAQDSFASIFEDKSKYNAIMNALAGVIYREMREKGKKKGYDSETQDVMMVAESGNNYGKNV